MSLLNQLEKSVGKVVATAGVATYLLFAPATVQAQERAREDCTLSCGTPAVSDSSVSAADATKQVKKGESLYLTPLSPEKQAELDKRVQELEKKVRADARHKHSHTHAEYETSITVLRDRVYGLMVKYGPLRGNLDTIDDALNSLSRSTSTLTETQRELVDQIETIVGRLEQYDKSRKDVEARLNDPVMQYMKTIFARGLGELDRAKAHETDECTKVLQAYAQVATLESRIATERTALAKERELVADILPKLEKNQTLSAYDKVQQAEELRHVLDEKEATIADREENAQRLASAIPHLNGLCEEAKAAYDALKIELPARVEKNIFGKENNTFKLEAGVQYGYADIGSSPVHRVSVLAAACYENNTFTLCAGGGVGKAGESTSVSDLSTPVIREQNGEYTEASSQTGTQTNGQRYQGEASLRLAPAAVRVGSGSRWTLTPSVVAKAEFVRDRVTRDVTRTTQLSAAEQPVGNPVSAPGSDTEYSTGVIFVPGVAGDLCRNVGNRENGPSICARVGLGYDTKNEIPTFNAAGVFGF